jgi:hypothetical protein
MDHTILPSFAKSFFGKEENSKQRIASKKTQTTTQNVIHIQIWQQDLFESIFQS